MATFCDMAYTWDANKNKTSESITGVMSGYGFTSAGTTYDNEDRLTGFSRAATSGPALLSQSWSLTAVGDWTSVTTNGTAQNRTHGPTHELLTAGGQNVATDVKGNITTLPANLRPSGSTSAMNLTWDSDNKLRSADIDANGTADVNFQYDALGRRVARSGTGGSEVYVQMDQHTIADYPVGGAATTPTFRYVFASYIDEPVVRKTAGTGGTLVYFHRNQQYSITAVTTSAGAVTERYAYTAYGLPTILDASASVLSSSAINNHYTYTGREWDATLGLHHFRARWMNSIAGRFLSRDPIGYVGNLNGLYEVFESNAFRYADPTGNQARLAQANAAPGFERPVCCRFYGPTLIGGTSNPLPYNAQVIANPGESSWDACQRVAGGYWYTPTVLGVDENGCTGVFHYGNFCGPFRKAYRSDCEENCPGSPQNVGPDPIDDLDAACFNHDCCVGRFIDWINPVWHRYCNKTFCDKLSSLSCSASPHPFECETYRLRAWLLSCGSLGGFPLP